MDTVRFIWKFLLERRGNTFHTEELAYKLGTRVVDAHTSLEEYLEKLEDLGVIERLSGGNWLVTDKVLEYEFIFGG